MAQRKRILSGMRPTGGLHLGHLVGTLDNWVKLQDEYDCYFMVADWHAFMGEYEKPSVLSRFSIDNVIDWLAFGIDPAKSTVFIQSRVPEHLELHMVFSCLTPLGWLERCPTYKEQLREVTTRDLNTYGFLGYPVLQAADILLYKAERVPVGEDQLPHLELTREIARRFNSLYSSPVFPDPQAILTATARLPGTDGRKMSKSYNNAINLSDPADEIRKKVQSMITDPARIKLADKGHPKICNVFAYYQAFAPQDAGEVSACCESASVGCTECKKRLAQKVIDRLAPFKAKRSEFENNPERVREILDEGQRKASAFASATMREVKAVIGI